MTLSSTIGKQSFHYKLYAGVNSILNIPSSLTLFIILGILIVIWLYALIFYQGDEVPVSPNEIKKPPHKYQKQIDYFLLPFRLVIKGITAILKFLYRVVVEGIFELIFWGIIRFIFHLIRILFTALFRIFD
ncbi:hypothetical protein [Acinetobacter gerneri]|uniref:hypothetical protein n=1 Tax=Acinetobacter gerneri TaxID=202952 RepID=UPI0028A665E7|nr:hypothetical protein [Acinetobacter gerneri]